MAMSELKVTPSQLKSKASEFKGKANKVRATTNKMVTEMKSSNGATGSGEAAEAYKKQFSKLENDMNDMFKMITEYSTDLEDIANEYQKTEQANGQIAQALATDVIK